MNAKVPAIRIAPRDLLVLNELGTYGILSTTDVKEIFFPNETDRACRKRLRLFSLHGLTRMTKLTVAFSRDGRGGSIPTLHSLTDDGADLVETQTGSRPPRILRTSPSPFTFFHRMEIVQVIRQFNTGCERAGLSQPEWIMEQDPYPDAPTSSPPNQRRLLYHAFQDGRTKFTAQPDIASRFAIGTTEIAVFWEVDRSTEGLKQIRTNKLEGHLALVNEFLAGTQRRYWSDFEPGFAFVFWVCPSSKRVAELSAVATDHAVAPLYRFVTRDVLDNPHALLCEKVWSTVAGEFRALYSPRN